MKTKITFISIAVASALLSIPVLAADNNWDLTTLVENSTNSGSDSRIEVALGVDDEVGSYTNVSGQNSSESSSNNFQRGEMETFDLNNQMFDANQDISSVHIQGGNDALRMDKIWVRNTLTGNTYEWDGSEQIGGTSESLTMDPVGDFNQINAKFKKFKITTKTLDLKNAGTDNVVYITLVDKYGKSSQLMTLGNDFNRNSTNTTTLISEVELSQIDQVIIHKRGKNGWKPDSLEVNPVDVNDFDIPEENNFKSVFEFTKTILDGYDRWDMLLKDDSLSIEQPGVEGEKFSIYYNNTAGANNVKASVETGEDSNVNSTLNDVISPKLARNYNDEQIEYASSEVREIGFSVNGDYISCEQHKLEGSLYFSLEQSESSEDYYCIEKSMSDAIVIHNNSSIPIQPLINDSVDSVLGWITKSGSAKVYLPDDNFLASIFVTTGENVNLTLTDNNDTWSCGTQFVFTNVNEFVFNNNNCSIIKQ